MQDYLLFLKSCMQQSTWEILFNKLWFYDSVLILIMHKGFLALVYEKELLSPWQLRKDQEEVFFCVN